MLVGYDSSGDDEDIPVSHDNPNLLPSNTNKAIPTGSNNAIITDHNASLVERFNRLKRKRKTLKEDNCDGEPAEAQSNTKDIHQKKRKKKTRRSKFEEINKYMEHSYVVTPQHDVFHLKKSKLECELDEAVCSKDYSRAEELNNEIIKRTFATDVKNAFKAKTFLADEKSKKEKKNKRKKLNWIFNQKQRWELKGNM